MSRSSVVSTSVVRPDAWTSVVVWTLNSAPSDSKSLRCGIGGDVSQEWVVAVEPAARAARLAGEFDIANVQVVRAALATLTIESSPVLLDLEAVDFCSAALLTCLLELRNRTREALTIIHIVRASPRVRWLLEITNTANSFELGP